jgi:hypothetical protein
LLLIYIINCYKTKPMTYKQILEEFRVDDTLTDFQLEKIVSVHKNLFYKQWSEADHYSTLVGAREATRLAQEDIDLAHEYVHQLVQEYKDLADSK